MVELLAPAADAAVAMAAIDAGADAVYIGGPAFGARSKAGNSLQDVERVVCYAHRYAAKCYLALNTILYDHEMDSALRLAKQAHAIGVDALIIQDMGLLGAGLPPMELHASTQCHISTPEKARFLESVGFKRLVLSRELSLDEIKKIADSVQTEIECFIHGALCVSYSGQCYMSCYMGGRSGNRGECAQSCRLAYDLQNAQGEVLQQNRHLLSMKDFNADDFLEDLIASGAHSLKIEGRLKDATYVKNITAHYRRRIDQILSREPHLQRPSQGMSACLLTPDLQKSYHRPYTSFNLSGKRTDWAVFDTPKAIGEEIGRVVAVEKNLPGRYSGLVLRISPTQENITFANGDGLCFYGENHRLAGGNLESFSREGREYRLCMQGLNDEAALPKSGAVLYRNHDTAFEKAWQQGRIQRKIPVEIHLNTDTLEVKMQDEYGHEVKTKLEAEQVQTAQNAQTAEEAIKSALMKLGDTAYAAPSVNIAGKRKIFVPLAALNAYRRHLSDALNKKREEAYQPQALSARQADKNLPFPELKTQSLSYTANIANLQAEKFYREHGADTIEKAFELLSDKEKESAGRVLMVCKHCIRHQLGQCLKKKPSREYAGDLYLCGGRHKFALHFDCEHCRMEVRTC